jgi:hypothetical protein
LGVDFPSFRHLLGSLLGRTPVGVPGFEPGTSLSYPTNRSERQ